MPVTQKQAQPAEDPWAAAAAQYKQSGTPSATEGQPTNDDWKMWNVDEPRSQMADPSLAHRIQNSFDANTKTSPSDPLLETGLKSVVGSIGNLFIHPVESAKGMYHSSLYPVPGTPSAQEVKRPDQISEDYKAGGLPYAATKMAGNLLGQYALMHTGGMAASKMTPLVPSMSTISDFVYPTRAKAGSIFNDLKASIGNEPVKMSPSTMNHLERTQQLTMAGGKPFGAADKLYQRINTINDLPYSEARDFSQNMSLSPEEKMSLKKSMKYEVPKLARSFGDDIQATADRAGMGAEHQRAMTMYGRAARRASTTKALANYGGKAALGAMGAGTAYELGKILTDKN